MIAPFSVQLDKCVDYYSTLSATKVWHGKESVETQDCMQLCAGLVINKFHQEPSLLARHAGPKQMLQQHNCRHQKPMFEPSYWSWNYWSPIHQNHVFSFLEIHFAMLRYIYILFWFGIASRLENKPWQAASLQEFASAVSYASSRVRDPFGSLRDFDDFFCYGSTRLYTLAGIYCNILSCIISCIFSVHRGSLILCFSAAAMIWSQFWIWFDLRKQLAQKQRLIRTFDVGGSGVKTVAWHNQPRGPSDEQGRYAWVSIKLELADSDVVQTDRYGLMGYRQVCRFGRWVR